MAFNSFIKPLIVVLSTLLLSSILVVSLDDTGPSDITSWCDKTPYPKQCEYYLRHNQNSPPIKGKSDFRKMVMESALQNTMKAHQSATSLGDSCKSVSEKAAWTDCVELYELSIQHLNQSMATTCTQVDAQTWLGSALTLFETCLNGFTDLGVTNNVMHMISNNNVTSLISNALAMNCEPGGSNGSGGVDNNANHNDGFPSWVRPGDRKLLQATSGPRANVVVAQDGSGNFKSIAQALGAAKGGGRFVIYIKAGTYNENVQIGSNLKNIMLLGDGIGKTIITGSRSVGGGSTTFNSATVAATGSGFMAQGITFRNTAGPANHQAVALRSNSDLSVFYKCSFEGYQDTLYVFSNRQFYRECDIYGTVDFIFGNAVSVLQNCNIYARLSPSKTVTITAQGRTDPNENTGISIQNSRISAAEDLKGSRTYLGRPWKQYSRTVYSKTFMSNIIDPRGWLEWSGSFALSTLYYGEFANTGPGSSTAGRVKWPGFHVLSAADAGKFTVGSFIAGTSWLPSTGVPFAPGL